jgi:hypothetical protein
LFSGSWNTWYTVSCILEKRRTLNASFFEIVRININNLGNCDRLDSNFSTIKSLEMKNETTKKIETMKIELEIKLERIKNANAAAIQTATSFSWLALVTIVFLFVVAISSDFFKVVSFLKDNLFIKMKKQNNYKKNENNNLGSDGENVFRKVVEKDKILFNHPYFRKNKKN